MISRKTKIIFPFLFCFAGFAFAQNVDSAKKELNRAQTENQKLSLTYLVGDIYSLKENVDSSILYLNKALKLATEQHNDSMIMESEGRLGGIAYGMSKYPLSVEHRNKAIAIAKATKNYGREMTFMIAASAAYSDMEQYELSIEQATAALAIAIELHDKKNEAIIYEAMTNAYTFSNRYDVALDYMNRSIKIYDTLKDSRGLQADYGLIVSIFGRQKKYKEALKYGLILDSMDAISASREYRNSDRMNLAIIYKNLGEYDKAISIYHEILKNTPADTFTQMFAYNNLGIALAARGDYKEARKCFLLCDQINNKSFHMPEMEFDNHKDIANAFYKAGRLDSALYYGKLSEKAVSKNEVRPIEYKEIIDLLADIYAAKGDIKNAQAYYKKYGEIQDSIFADQQNKNVAEQETRFRLNEKNKELTLVAKENELNKIKEQRQTIALVLGALIVIIVVIVYRRTLKKNELLSQQKEIIDAQVKQLEAAATMKSKFLANISHELRTPVTLLTGMLELMSKKTQPDDPKEKERLNVAYNNSRKLQHMVEEILDLTKLENKVSQPVYETKEITPLLKRIVYAFETLIEKEHLLLEYDDAQAQGAYISIDQGKFEKVINNLVYNAIKFNKEGGKLSVCTYRSGDGKHVIIEVSDSGIGISEADMPYIFDHFYQSEVSGLKADGAGIGLSLVKEFTHLMGGTVDVTSEQGKGSTFSLRFPLVVVSDTISSQQEEIEQAPAEAWEKLGRPQTVLIVEDNEEMRYYLKEVLGEKVNIIEAGNGKEGLKWLQNNIPDLVISDVMMPEMDGREFINIVKNDDRFKKIPVITLTALADIENQLSFLRMGIDDYIVKPFNADELRIRVYNLLTNQAERKTFNEQPAEIDDIKPDTKEEDEFRKTITEYVVKRVRDTNISVYDLAYELSVSERQLFRMAKSLTGCSPAQLIKEVRLQQAYELLIGGHVKIYKVEDVARRVGYESAGYFAQQFFERFGKRPSEFL